MGYATECRSAISVGWSEDIGAREEMEDGFVFVDCYGGNKQSAYFAIYDGHGGRQCVDYITQTLHEVLLRELQEAALTNTAVPDAIVRAYSTVDANMYNSGITSSGCTSCSCLVHEDNGKRVLYTAHVGDARAVICRRGQAVRLTAQSDHKATDPDETDRVRKAGGQIINERVNGMLAIARALGDHQLKMPVMQQNIVSNFPDITSTPLQSDDMFVIVACDGLWDVLLDQAAVNIVLEAIRVWAQVGVRSQFQDEESFRRPMAEIFARCLVEEALARGTSDNVTCLLFFPN